MIEVAQLSIPGILHEVSFQVRKGERVGIIGESGSGKSLTAHTIMGLNPLEQQVAISGQVSVCGVQMVGTSDRVRRKVRGAKVAMVFQEPMTALDPLKQVGKLVPRHLLREVGVDRPQAYPHELSGGQRQRVLIALALAQNPDFLLCDEPTTALDVTVQRQVLELIDRLVGERNMGLLFISHDLAVVKRITDRVLVFHQRRIVGPESDYAKRLVAASAPKPLAPPRRLGEPVISLRGVSVRRGATQALSEVDLTVRAGARVGIVGGSGSGKSTLLHVIAGLRQPDAGQVQVRGLCQMVFQDPYASLNPKLAVGRSVAESGVDKKAAAAMLAAVGLAGVEQRLPREFSGGQRQRISIARAAAPRPEILLADEPVSALDVSLRAQVIELLDELSATLVFVSHDLGVVRELCPEVVVMFEGRVVEAGPTAEVLEHPQHPYTRALVDSVL